MKDVVYRLLDEDGNLLYIGKSNNLLRRMQQHAKTQPWWSEVKKADVTLYPCRCAAEDAERRAIRTERPRHNKTHNWERGYQEWVEQNQEELDHLARCWAENPGDF